MRETENVHAKRVNDVILGSHAAHMLLRSGIKKIRLIDFDQVTLSSLNRHAVARLADVGLSKVKVMQEAFQAIAPWCEIEAIESLFQADEADALLAGASFLGQKEI